jgi:hypothetical protein
VYEIHKKRVLNTQPVLVAIEMFRYVLEKSKSTGEMTMTPALGTLALISHFSRKYHNPHQLSSHLSVSLDNLKCIRAGVADALLADETIGCSSVVEVIDWVAGKQKAYRPQQLIVGSISALELTAHSLSVGNESVSSGCEALD